MGYLNRFLQILFVVTDMYQKTLCKICWFQDHWESNLVNNSLPFFFGILLHDGIFWSIFFCQECKSSSHFKLIRCPSQGFSGGSSQVRHMRNYLYKTSDIFIRTARDCTHLILIRCKCFGNPSRDGKITFNEYIEIVITLLCFRLLYVCVTNEHDSKFPILFSFICADTLYRTSRQAHHVHDYIALWFCHR